MRVSVAGRWLVMSCLVLLASCGGGGGGGGSSAPLSFSPATAGDSVQQSETGTLTETVTVANPGAVTGPAYVTVVDTQSVLVGTDAVSAIDAGHFAVSVYTSASLSVGHHRGSFQIRVCKDEACTQDWMPPSTLPYDIDVEAAPLRAVPSTSTDSTTAWKASDHDVIQISVTGGTQWTASSGASWLVVAAPTGGTSPGTVSASFATEQLAVGDYSTVVTVSSDAQSVQVPVTLHVIPPQFAIDAGGSPAFSAINGAPIAPQPFSFELDNGTAEPWALSSDSAWLSASAFSGTTPASLMLSANPAAGALASGSYDGTLTLTSAGIANKTVAASLQLIRPTLSTAVPSVTLGGARGRDPLATQSVLLTLNTGTNSYPVSMSTLPSWLAVSPSQPAVGQAGTPLTIGANAAGITPGSTSYSVVFTSTINGDTVTAPLTVNLNADQRRLLPSSWGVAFASSPTGTTTSRTLQIADNFGGALDWTAVSDSAWLSASAGGNTGGTSSLVLTADPALVPTDGVSVASVRVASTTAGVAPAVVRVAIWKSATGATTITKLNGVVASALVADKIRPYVYVNDGGTSITVYNAYTAAVVGTVSNVGVKLGPMAVSPDGSLLYAVDYSSQSLKVVDLATLTNSASWPLTQPADNVVSILAIRPNGVEVVLLGDGTAYTNGRALPSTGIVAWGNMSATDDGRKVYTIDTGGSPASQVEWTLDYSEISGGVLYASAVYAPFFTGSESNGRDIAVAPDGSAVYTASGAPYTCVSLSPVDLSLVKYMPGGDAYPNNVEVTHDNRLICGIEGYYSTSDIWVYTPGGAIAASYKVAGYAETLRDRQMVVTPDGFVVATSTFDPLLAFVAIGP